MAPELKLIDSFNQVEIYFIGGVFPEIEGTNGTQLRRYWVFCPTIQSNGLCHHCSG